MSIGLFSTVGHRHSSRVGTVIGVTKDTPYINYREPIFRVIWETAPDVNDPLRIKDGVFKEWFSYLEEDLYEI